MVEWTQSFVKLFSLTPVLILLPTVAICLFVEEDLKHFQCQEGWVGLPKDYEEYMNDCYKDKTVSPDCRRHCLARKMNLVMEDKIWLFQLLDVLKRLFPGKGGRHTVEKAVDVILECTDYHYKMFGPMLPYTCYREHEMWRCILRDLRIICKWNHLRDEEKKGNLRAHHDVHDSPKARKEPDLPEDLEAKLEKEVEPKPVRVRLKDDESSESKQHLALCKSSCFCQFVIVLILKLINRQNIERLQLCFCC